MKYNPKIHHNRSYRLKGYDYSAPGYYFITICTENRIDYFGEIKNGQMILNEKGHIVLNEWKNTSVLRPNVSVDEFVIMPNHFHCVIAIRNRMNGPDDVDNNGIDAGADFNAAGAYCNTHLRSPSQTVGAIIRGFKSVTTKKINILDNEIKRQLWQRNYWDHIVRNDNELFLIRQYIRNNPANWGKDIMKKTDGLTTMEEAAVYGEEPWMI